MRNFKRFIIFVMIVTILFQKTIQFYWDNPLISYLDEFIITFFFLYSLISIFMKKSINKTSVHLLLLTLIFITIGLLSFKFNSIGSTSNLLNSAFLSVKFLILVISFMNITVKKSTVNYALSVLLVLAFINSLFVIINFIMPDFYHRLFPFVYIDNARILGFGGAMGLFVHPGIAGWFSLLVGSIYLSRYSQKAKKSTLVFTIFHFFIALLSLRVKVILSMIALISFYILFVSARKSRMRNVVIGAFPMVIFLVVFQNMIIENLQKYIFNVGLYGVSVETSARSALLSNSIQIVRDYFPLGVGFSKYGSWFARVNYSEYYYKYGMSSIYGLTPSDPKFATDTYWPAILGETGIMGTVIYIGILLLITKKLIQKFNQNKIEKNYSYFMAVLSLFIFGQAILESFGEAIFNSSPQNIVLGIIIGIAASNKLKESD
ncbi:hypothetical protein A5821_003163 [Enterococcus sp. 7F3_DIV0205]|uniref:O-antigen ligase-related domain-containing protein n=1 Tax=Candidatus Enterococcus palustris TaxID=1834189 RepID=A0AAQ3WDG7_9ENTE|nr:O-antigen ligase family protein [Enterococcus sp. 7F3_DIV0205]OTN83597.1 hypothetical protein A5821_003520 [Enterococcus sp. 7F3_DIV0205]